MNINLSPLHRFAEQIKPYLFPVRERGEDPFGAYFRSLEQSLPPLPTPASCSGPAEIREHLDAVQNLLSQRVPPYLGDQKQSFAIDTLSSQHSFSVLYRQAHLADALHHFAFSLALRESILMAPLCLLEQQAELEAKTQHLRRKEAQWSSAKAQREAEGDGAGESEAQRDYYRKMLEDLEGEIHDLRESTSQGELGLPNLESFRFTPVEMGERLVLFARGGYGRGELSFSSDVDTGYCLDTHGLLPGESLVFQEVVRRTENLVAASGMTTVHQYFELEENLERFGRPDTLHTVPAILESRAIAGNSEVLGALQKRFYGVASFDALVRKKVEEFNVQPHPDLTSMDLKSDFGGLRSIQIPLWLLGITHKADSFLTTDLLQLGRQQKVLSIWEVAKLLLGMEFLYDLRNFIGAAESHHYDREARESGFHVQQFHPNRIDDQVAGLYLFRKHRFPSLDAFDAYRLQLVNEVQRISTRLLARVLDRTVTQKTGTLRVSVHLGRRCIEAVNSAHNGGSADLRTLFQGGRSILTLFAFVAETDYDLSDGLKNALAGSVLGLTHPDGMVDRSEQVRLFNDMLLAPYAHRALASMLEINDPLAPGMPSLLGCFIPAMDRARFLVRRYDGEPMVMQRHMIKALEGGQAMVEELDRDYPDLAALLGREDRLALKWSLFLIGIGRVDEERAPASRSAETAVEILAALGIREQEFERKVRLMIEHHGTLIALSRTATYMDQALAQLFEIAERDLTRVVLVYLANMGALHTRGDDTRGDGVRLRQFFAEALELMGEMRGFPLKERSLELINVYFDRKKVDLIQDTRLHRLYQRVLYGGVEASIAAPVREWNQEAFAQLEHVLPEYERLQREIVLGSPSSPEREGLESRLISDLRKHLGREAIEYLMGEEEKLLSWFFHAYPNRYLIGSRAADLAQEMVKFDGFAETDVMVDVVPASSPGGAEGLLISTRGLSRSHSLVAFALSRMELNIISGKVNAVDYEGGESGFCYFIEFSQLNPDTQLMPHDLELTIRTQKLPESVVPTGNIPYERGGVRVEFRGNDRKGYRVVPAEHGFKRVESHFNHIRLVLRDRPLLFYKVCRTFDLYQVNIRQALITTTGNQVLDYFYLAPDDYERLRHSDFEEVCSRMILGDLLDLEP